MGWREGERESLHPESTGTPCLNTCDASKTVLRACVRAIGILFEYVADDVRQERICDLW